MLVPKSKNILNLRFFFNPLNCILASLQPQLLTPSIPSQGAIPPLREGLVMFEGTPSLLAVPKKKVSHMKKRQKLYAPKSKQLQFIHNLNKCPSCGHYKRSHTLCMHCFSEIKKIWKLKDRNIQEEEDIIDNLSELDKRILYPGKKQTEYQKKLEDKDSYLLKRLRTLPVPEKKK